MQHSVLLTFSESSKPEQEQMMQDFQAENQSLDHVNDFEVLRNLARAEQCMGF